jgi:hypothetical protein
MATAAAPVKNRKNAGPLNATVCMQREIGMATEKEQANNRDVTGK